MGIRELACPLSLVISPKARSSVMSIYMSRLSVTVVKIPVEAKIYEDADVWFVVDGE